MALNSSIIFNHNIISEFQWSSLTAPITSSLQKF